jgi:hypothetical protein
LLTTVEKPAVISFSLSPLRTKIGSLTGGSPSIPKYRAIELKTINAIIQK